MKKIVILGAGPTGLGAGYHLRKLNYKNFTIYEKNNYVGGLASSFKDKFGFTWDIGGHILFSDYKYFNKLLSRFLKDECLFHERKSFIKLMDCWVPYPFQNNLRYLPPKITLECLLQLLNRKSNLKAKNFQDWIYKSFGAGVAKYFMLPYNQKIWAYPLDKMNYSWITERVNVIDLKRVIKNIILKLDDVNWGKNFKFVFPLYGGTQGFFNKFYPYIKDKLYFNKELINIDLNKKELTFKGGFKDKYDLLISTIPLTELVKSLRPANAVIKKTSYELKHNRIYVIGLGFNKPINADKCWVYFPEKNVPFYRLTYFSNYSPNNVPGGKINKYSSLMCETAFYDFKKVNQEEIIKDTLEGLIKMEIIIKEDKKNIISSYLYQTPYAYPIPTLKRDKALKIIQQYLLKNNIYSRGRFGAWKYEIGNMDHSVMQGKEAVDNILRGKKETIWSL